jgi:hypothetical protein
VREWDNSRKRLKITGGNECDTLVLGSLIKGLKGLGLWPVPATPDEVNTSVMAVLDGLLSLHCFALADKSGSESSHEGCKFTTSLNASIQIIKEGVIAWGVDESHRKHMRAQGKKLASAGPARLT